MRKIRRTYNKLNSMAFVANARPEQSDTHSCSLNKGIGCKSRTRKESASAVKRQRGRLPKVAVFLKCCFPCRTHPACGENRSFEELSWLREKAEAMRLREKEDAVSETAGLHAHEWISQKTYKKQNLRNTSIIAGSCDVKKLSKGLHSEDLSQKR